MLSFQPDASLPLRKEEVTDTAAGEETEASTVKWLIQITQTNPQLLMDFRCSHTDPNPGVHTVAICILGQY